MFFCHLNALNFLHVSSAAPGVEEKDAAAGANGSSITEPSATPRALASFLNDDGDPTNDGARTAEMIVSTSETSSTTNGVGSCDKAAVNNGNPTGE